MLVLGRKAGQIVDVYYDGMLLCSVSIADVSDGRVRLGFQACDEVKILRREMGSLHVEQLSIPRRCDPIDVS